MLERKMEYHFKKINAQLKNQQIANQLLIQQILKNLETKPECKNFTQEVVTSLEALRDGGLLGKASITAAIALTRDPVKSN